MMMTNWNTGPEIQGGNATTQQTNPAQTQNPANAEDLRAAARELREAIRNNVQQELNATRAAQGVRGTPVSPTPPAGHPTFTFRGPDGTQTVVGVPSSMDRDMPPEVVDISIAFFITIGAIIIGLPLARAFARRMDRRTSAPQIPTEVASQLSQLNQSVDAIALEVERISEGQRFAARILSEQRDARLPSTVKS
jgi:hypothetical protein